VAAGGAAAAAVAGGGRKQPKKATLKVTMDTYRRMRDFFAFTLRRQEETELQLREQAAADKAAGADAGAGAGAAGADADVDDADAAKERALVGAMTFGELVAAWLQSKAATAPFATEADRDAETTLARKVLQKLLQDTNATGDSILFYAQGQTGSGMDDDGAVDVSSIPLDDRYVKLDAGYVVPGLNDEW
jgi:hypothetical protein